MDSQAGIFAHQSCVLSPGLTLFRRRQRIVRDVTALRLLHDVLLNFLCDDNRQLVNGQRTHQQVLRMSIEGIVRSCGPMEIDQNRRRLNQPSRVSHSSGLASVAVERVHSAAVLPLTCDPHQSSVFAHHVALHATGHVVK